MTKKIRVVEWKNTKESQMEIEIIKLILNQYSPDRIIPKEYSIMLDKFDITISVKKGRIAK